MQWKHVRDPAPHVRKQMLLEPVLLKCFFSIRATTELVAEVHRIDGNGRWGGSQWKRMPFTKVATYR